MTLREAAQMALDALEDKCLFMASDEAIYKRADAIKALRAVLENEFNPDWDAMAVMVEEQQRMAKRIEELESAAQREWQGLTDEEVRDLWSWSMTAEAERTANTQQHAFARAIEAKLKEKNS